MTASGRGAEDERGVAASRRILNKIFHRVSSFNDCSGLVAFQRTQAIKTIQEATEDDYSCKENSECNADFHKRETPIHFKLHKKGVKSPGIKSGTSVESRAKICELSADMRNDG